MALQRVRAAAVEGVPCLAVEADLAGAGVQGADGVDFTVGADEAHADGLGQGVVTGRGSGAGQGAGICPLDGAVSALEREVFAEVGQSLLFHHALLLPLCRELSNIRQRILARDVVFLAEFLSQTLYGKVALLRSLLPQPCCGVTQLVNPALPPGLAGVHHHGLSANVS